MHKQNLSDRDRCLQLEAKLAGEQNKVRKLTAELKAAREAGGFEDENSPLPTLAQKATLAHSPGLETKLIDMTKERDNAVAEKKRALAGMANAASARESAQSSQASAEARMVEALASRDAASAAAAASEARANALVREAAAAAAEKSTASSKSDDRVKALEAALAKSNEANEVAMADLAEARKTLAETKEALSAAEASVAEQAQTIAMQNEECLLLNAALEGRDQEVQRLRSRVRVLEEQAAATCTEMANRVQSHEAVHEQQLVSDTQFTQESIQSGLPLIQATDATFEPTVAEPAAPTHEATATTTTVATAVEAEATTTTEMHEALEAAAPEQQVADLEEDHSPLVFGAAAVALAAASEESSNGGGGRGGRSGRRRSMRLQRMSVGPPAPSSPLAENEAESTPVAAAPEEANEETIPQLSIEAALAMTDNFTALPETGASTVETADAPSLAAISNAPDKSIASESDLAPHYDGNSIDQDVNIQPAADDSQPNEVPASTTSAPVVEKEEEAISKEAAATQKTRAKKAKGRRRRSGVFGDFPKSAGNKKSLLSDNFIDEEEDMPPPASAPEDLEAGDDWNVGVLHWDHNLAPSSNDLVAHDGGFNETGGLPNEMPLNPADSHSSEAAQVSSSAISGDSDSSAGQQEAGETIDFFSPCKGAPPPSPGVAPSPAAQLASKQTLRKSPAAPMAPLHDDDEEEEEEEPDLTTSAVETGEDTADDYSSATVPLSALTAESLASTLAVFSSEHISSLHSTTSQLSMAAACAMVCCDGDDATTAALAPFMAAVVEAEHQVAKGCANPAASSSVPGERRVQFASHDFSAVAPPVDTIESSDLEAEACVDALAAVMAAKQALIQAQPDSGFLLLQRVSAALAALACALWADDNTREYKIKVSEKETLKEILHTTCSERGINAKHLAANADLLAAELCCSDDSAGAVASSTLGPLRTRLLELASGQVRFHLRRLLNAPPPPATTPCHTQNTSGSYSESGCRSSAHKLFTFDEPPHEAPPTKATAAAAAAAKNESECPFAEGAVASVVTHALEAMHWAECASSADEVDVTSLTSGLNTTFASLPSQDLPVAMSTVQHAHMAAAGARGAAFLHALLEWPGLQNAVAQHGGWSQVEKFASYLKQYGSYGGHEEGGKPRGSGEPLHVAHLAPLSDMAQLRLSVAPGGHWHRISTALQPLRASLFHLKQSHAVGIVNAFSDDDANEPDPTCSGIGDGGAGTSATRGGRSASGRRKRGNNNGGEVPRCLLIALGEETVPFPSLAYVSPVTVVRRTAQ